MALGDQFANKIGANEAGSASDENFHGKGCFEVGRVDLIFRLALANDVVHTDDAEESLIFVDDREYVDLALGRLHEVENFA